MKFKSKVDWWFYLTVALMILANLSAIPIMLFSDRIAGIIMLATFVPINLFLMLPTWLNTYYYVGNNVLLVKCGLFTYAKIPIDVIASISPSRSMMSSAALSMDKLEVRYVKQGYPNAILISPKDKSLFAAALVKQNDKIVVSSEPLPMTRAGKITILAVGLTLIATVIGVGALFIVGEREPDVRVYSHAIRVRAMFGTEIDTSDIESVALVHQSMRDIGAGRRRNGYNGRAWRGNFEAGLVFVRPNSTPTIHITRHEGSDVFISFRDSMRTKQLYSEIAQMIVN